jgi:hypothetical protein
MQSISDLSNPSEVRSHLLHGMDAEPLAKRNIRILGNKIGQFLLQSRLGDVMYHLCCKISTPLALSICSVPTDLWRVIQNSSVHSLIRNPPNELARQTGDKIDPTGIFALRALLANSLLAQPMLPQDLERAWVDGVGFGGC